MQADDVGRRCRFIYSPQRGGGRSLWRAFSEEHSVSSIYPGHPGMECSALPDVERFGDAWETTARPGYWCEERPWFPFSLLWMAALTSQQIGTTGRTNNKARAKSTLFCCGALVISFWYLLWLQSVSMSRGEWLGFKNKGSLWAGKADLWLVPITVFKNPG